VAAGPEHQTDEPPGVPTLSAARTKRARSARSAWGQLLRLPNLLTAPGDPIAGYLLAGAGAQAGVGEITWRIIPAACASLLLYATGLVQNDLADRRLDARQRPDRPIPSGAVSVLSASAVAYILGVTGLAAAYLSFTDATFWLAVILAALITLYNRASSRVSVAGPVNMGLCRGVSLLLGASAAGDWQAALSPTVLIAAGMIAIYIAAVTAIADRETATSRIGLIRWAPAAVLLVGCVAIISVQPALVASLWPIRSIHPLVWLAGALAIITGWSVLCGRRLAGVCGPDRVGKTIGMFVRGLLPIQAALAVISGDEAGRWAAAGLLSAWPMAGLLARRFPSS